MKKIGIIGGGNMGSAILAGIYKNNSVSVCESDLAKAAQLKKTFKVKILDLASVLKSSEVIIVAVKPQDFDEILSAIKPFITKKHLIISIAAGITSSYIEERLGPEVRVIRTMPNLPAQVKMGVTGIAKGKNASSADLKAAKNIFDSIGQAVVVDEKLIDAVTALSGSGPAYVFLFVECLLKAADELGLDPKAAQTLTLQTLKGSLSLLESSKESAATLRERVTSKGGTTAAALKVFMEDYKIEEIFNKALKAARDRARELSK